MNGDKIIMIRGLRRFPQAAIIAQIWIITIWLIGPLFYAGQKVLITRFF